MKKNIFACFVMTCLLCCFGLSAMADEEAFLSFDEAVALALRQNLNLQSSQDRVTSARISLETAKSDFNIKVRPEISGLYQQNDELDQNYGVQFSKRFSYGGEVSWQAKTNVDDSLDEEYRTDVSVAYRQPLLRGRGTLATRNTLYSAEQNSRSQYRALLLSRQRLVVQVAASYYGIIRDRMLIDVNQRAVERAKLLHQAAEAKLKVGMASKMDVFRAELQALSAENSLVDAQASLENAERRFNLLLGVDMGAEFLFPSTLTYSPLRLDKDALIREAQENRLELQDARERIKDAERQLNIAKQNLLPPLDVSIRYTVRGEGDAFEKSLEMDDEFWGVGINSSFNLDLAQERANCQIAQLNLNGAFRALKSTQDDITSEVLQAMISVKQSESGIYLQEQSMTQAEQQLELSALRYKKGLSDNLDVVNAEENFVKAKNSYYSAIVQRLISGMQLQQVTGTLEVPF